MSPAQKAKRLAVIADEIDGARRAIDACVVDPSERNPLNGLLLAIGSRLRTIAGAATRQPRDGAR